MHGHTAAVHALQHLGGGEARGGEGCGVLVSCSADGAVRLWCLATLRCERVLLGHTAAVLCAAPAPPPPPAATSAPVQPPVVLLTGGADGTLRGWAAASDGGGGGGGGLRSGAVAARLVPAAHDGEIYAACACGTELVSAGKDGQLRLWSAAALQPAGTLGAPRAHRGAIFALLALTPGRDLDPDLDLGAELASADAHGEVSLWSVRGRCALRSLRVGGAVCALQLLPGPKGARLCAAGGRGELVAVSLRRGAEEGGAAGEGAAPLALALTPVRAARGEGGESGGVLSLALSARRRLAFAGRASGLVSCWELPALPLPPPAPADATCAVLRGHGGCVWALATQGGELQRARGGERSEGAWLFSGAGGRVRVWWHAGVDGEAGGGGDESGGDRGGGGAGAGAGGAEMGVECVGELACGDRDGEGGEVAADEAAAAAARQRRTVYALLPLAADLLLVGLGDGQLLLWRRAAAAAGAAAPREAPRDAAARWQLAQRCAAHEDSALCLAAPAADAAAGAAAVAFSAGADAAICRLRVPWRACGGKGGPEAEAGAEAGAGVHVEVTRRAAHAAPIHALALHDAHLVSAAADGTVRLWDAASLAPLLHLGGAAAHGAAVYALHAVPGAAGAAAAGAGAGGAEERVAAPPRLFSGSADRLIKAWDLNTLECTHWLEGHRSFVCALQSCRGVLFSASSDKVCVAWDLRTLQRLRTLEGHTSGVYALAVLGGHVCSGSLDETVRVWPRVAPLVDID